MERPDAAPAGQRGPADEGGLRGRVGEQGEGQAQQDPERRLEEGQETEVAAHHLDLHRPYRHVVVGEDGRTAERQPGRGEVAVKSPPIGTPRLLMPFWDVPSSMAMVKANPASSIHPAAVARSALSQAASRSGVRSGRMAIR